MNDIDPEIDDIRNPPELIYSEHKFSALMERLHTYGLSLIWEGEQEMNTSLWTDIRGSVVRHLEQSCYTLDSLPFSSPSVFAADFFGVFALSRQTPRGRLLKDANIISSDRLTLNKLLSLAIPNPQGQDSPKILMLCTFSQSLVTRVQCTNPGSLQISSRV